MSHRGSWEIDVARGNRLRVLLFVVAAVVVLVAIAAGGVLLFRRPPPGPRDVLDAWLTAAKADDPVALRRLTCAGTDHIDAPHSDELLSWRIASDTAVDVTYTVEGFAQHDRWTFELVQEPGGWRVCGVREELTEPDTPRSALVDWMAAIMAGDLATTQSLTCGAEAGAITPDEVASVRGEGMTYEITEVSKVSESTAQVAFTVQVTRNGGPVRFEERWLVVLEPDQTAAHAWKICGPVKT